MTRRDQRFLSGTAVYYEPLMPAAQYVKRARRARYEAILAEDRDPQSAEHWYREAIERFVDAFLVDRAGFAWCFTEAHRIGAHVRATYECRVSREENGWQRRCGVLALHQRVGLSIAGASTGTCSLCGARDFECDHVPGRVYDGRVYVRAVADFDLREISLVQFPNDLRCYGVQPTIPFAEMDERLGRRLRNNEYPICDHCLSCYGSTGGPATDDVDQTLWEPLPGDDAASPKEAGDLHVGRE
jgi:hypothetical protein